MQESETSKSARVPSMVLEELTGSVEKNGKPVQMSLKEWDLANVISKAISEAETNGFSLKRQMAFV